MNRVLNQENQNFLFNPRKNQNFLDAASFSLISLISLPASISLALLIKIISRILA